MAISPSVLSGASRLALDSAPVFPGGSIAADSSLGSLNLSSDISLSPYLLLGSLSDSAGTASRAVCSKPEYQAVLGID
jgi:hypothetical protein